MLRVGIAGIGFMGWIHYLAYGRTPQASVAAICSRDESKRSGDWTSIEGNFGPPGGHVDLSNVSVYSDFEAMIQDPQLDLIDICLPPHLHPQCAIAALRAGKHVLCEKPLALTVEDCQQMVEVAKQSGRQLLTAHVLPFFPEYVYARRVIASGEYGRLLGGNFKRIISDPTWIPDFYELDKVGGPLVDLHVHDAHLIRYLFGMPIAVTSNGRSRGGVVDFCNTLFEFSDPNLVVQSSCGVINQQGRPFTHGFEIHLEGATITYEFAAFADQGEGLAVKLLTADGEVIRPDLGNNDEITAFVAEIEEVAAAITSGTASPLLGGELASDAILMCHKQADSVLSRQRIALV